MNSAPPLLRLRNLSVTFGPVGHARPVVDRISFDLAPGEILAMVGESGSGKTMAARAVMGLLPPGARVTADSLRFKDQDLIDTKERALRRLRGAEIGMIFQEPMVSLNPSLTIGRQMAEAMRLHSDLSTTAIRAASIEMLERVKIAEPERCLARYPHAFSGGMRQRIMLASVMMLRPALLLADEPTTALDVLIQKQVLDIMVEVTRDLGTAVLLITHDLGVVASYAKRVAVMQSGRIVEKGPTEPLLSDPQHDYTRKLLAALPGLQERPPSDRASMRAPLLALKGLEVSYPEKRSWPWSPRRRQTAVAGVDIAIRSEETVALVGESGSGKTTLGRALLGLVPADRGSLRFEDRDWSFAEQSQRPPRQDLQIVFQDPFSSLDPRMRLVDIVAEGLRHAAPASHRERRARALEVLAEVGLPPDFGQRFPHELSGGQRQRVSIARAIVMRPKLIVADEPVSALDMTIQAQILTLLKHLQKNHGFSYLFISHDLGVVREIADRVVVLYRGQVVEEGPAAVLLEEPHHPYTAALLEAVPALERFGRGYRLSGRSLKATKLPSGYRFPEASDHPSATSMLEIAPGHRVACLNQ